MQQNYNVVMGISTPMKINIQTSYTDRVGVVQLYVQDFVNSAAKALQYILEYREDVKEFKIWFFFICVSVYSTHHSLLYVNNHQLNQEIATENPFILFGWQLRWLCAIKGCKAGPVSDLGWEPRTSTKIPFMFS